MTLSASHWGLLAVTLALGSGSAVAAPNDCLAYRDNPHVAACANQYDHGAASRLRGTNVASTAPGRSAPNPSEVHVIADPDLKSVPVVIATKAPAPAPAPIPETPMFTVDRQALANTVVIGAVAGSLLIIIALGAWRFGSSLLRDCPWCSSRISKSAHTCPRCFRAL
jgi:hypothetical protein